MSENPPHDAGDDRCVLSARKDELALETSVDVSSDLAP